MTDEKWAKAIIMHLTGRPDDPAPMLLNMIKEIRGNKSMSLSRPIADLPDDDTPVLARTADGSVMVWQARLLQSVPKKPSGPVLPNHLSFPAVEWMPVSDIPW